MKSIDLVKVFDDITIKFFEQEQEATDTLVDLENLLSTCETTFKAMTEKYKEEAAKIEQLMMDISSFELAICDDILNEDNDSDYIYEEDEESFDEDEVEQTLKEYGFTDDDLDVEPFTFSRKNFDGEEVEDVSVVENNGQEESSDTQNNEYDIDDSSLNEWKFGRLEEIQEAKQNLHEAKITIKQALEERLNQYNQILSEGDREKVLLESSWIVRDMPIYVLEIKKWGVQFQQYLDTLNSQKQASINIAQNILNNKNSDSLPVADVMSEASTLDQEKKNGNQNMLEELTAQINQKESEIEAKLENDLAQEEQKNLQKQNQQILENSMNSPNNVEG